MKKINLKNLFKEKLSKQFQEFVRRSPRNVTVSGLLFLFCAALSFYGAIKLPSPLIFCTLSIGCFQMIALFKEYTRLIPHKRKNQIQVQANEVFIDKEHVATIRYDQSQSLPLVLLYTTDPYQKGRALGRAFAREILDIQDRCYALLPTAMRVLHFRHFWKPGSLDAYIKQTTESLNIKLTPEFLAKAQGIVEEVNKLIVENNRSLVLQRKLLTLEDFKRLIVMPDIFKLGCSSAVRNHDHKDRPYGQLLHNFDYYMFGAAKEYTIGLAEPHFIPETKQIVHTFSVTFIPGLPGFTVFNDRGFGLTMNDATQQKTKRHIHKGGMAQLLLIQELEKHCTTIEEAETYLKKHPPATSHILTAMQQNQTGKVLEILPPNSEAIFTARGMKKGRVHVTNHHFDVLGNVIEESISWPTSQDRYQVMERQLAQRKEAFEVLNSVGCAETIHAMTFTYKPANERKGERLTMKIKLGEYYAADNSETIKVKIYPLFETIKSTRAKHRGAKL